MFAIREIAFFGESKQIKFKAVASCANVIRNVLKPQKWLVEGLKNAFGEMMWQRGFGRF